MKKLMALVFSLVVLAGAVEAHNISQPATGLTIALPSVTLTDDTLGKVVGTENIMHAGMAEVFTTGSGSGGGGVAPYVVYATGRAAYKVLTSKPALFVYANEAYNAIRHWFTGGGDKNSCR